MCITPNKKCQSSVTVISARSSAEIYIYIAEEREKKNKMMKRQDRNYGTLAITFRAFRMKFREKTLAQFARKNCVLKITSNSRPGLPLFADESEKCKFLVLKTLPFKRNAQLNDNHQAAPAGKERKTMPSNFVYVPVANGGVVATRRDDNGRRGDPR